VSATFRRLLRLELQETLRQRLTWMVFGALFVAMLIGAAAGAARVTREQNIMGALATERAKAVSESKAAAERYATPSDLKIDYHRDPTDAFGYMNYFLVAHAEKPPLPLAALAAGQSDLYPTYVRIDFTSIFPDATYDLDNPHLLKLGAFDLAFVLVYLAPLALIALAATRLTGEQDSGVLRMIAAQPIGPTSVAAAKYLAIGIVSIVLVVGGAALSLAVHGQLVLGMQAALVALALCLWVLVWIALAAWVATFWRGAIGSIVTLVLAWAVMTVLMPAAAALLVEVIHPAPSRVGYIDESRRAMDSFYGDEPQVHAAWLARQPQFSAAADVVKSPEVKRFARDDYYRNALLPERRRFEVRTRAVLETSDRLRLLSPAMMFDGMLQAVAGTDMARHASFLAEADAYSERLRRHFEPLALANAANPQRSCPQCPGRLNFTRYEDVPSFEPDLDLTAGMQSSLRTCLYLALIVTALVLLTRRRLSEWPH
jgi:ABC-2 type transport system permease protein